VPVTVTVYAPAEIVDGTVIDNVDEPDPPGPIETKDGLTVTLQPEGAEADSETVPLKPLNDATVTVELSEDPATIVKAEGDAEIE
jgi:hypothetical protein